MEECQISRLVLSPVFSKRFLWVIVFQQTGFTFREKLAAVGGTLKIPHFTKGKSQLSGEEVDTSRELSNVRIHVEKVIGQIKKFISYKILYPLPR